MLDVMYDIPSDSSIKKFTITKDMVEKKDEEVTAEVIQLEKKSQAEIA